MRGKFALFIIIALLVQACGGESTNNLENSDDPLDVISEAGHDSTVVLDEILEAQPKDETTERIVDEQIAKSPFKDLGCCSDEQRRKKESCCCNEVLASYKKLRAENSPDIARLKSEDPILAGCIKKLSKAFEEVDNPPSEEDEDDLF